MTEKSKFQTQGLALIKNVRPFLYSQRGILIALLALLAIFFGKIQISTFSVLSGISLILLGAWVRLLARSEIGLHTRLNHIEVNELITRGVYSTTRNPLYISNLLIIFGWMIFAGLPLVILVLFQFLFIALYHQIALAEEAYLKETFGPQFATYQKEVPRWFTFKNLSRFLEYSFALSRKEGARVFKEDRWTWFWQFITAAVLVFLEGRF